MSDRSINPSSLTTCDKYDALTFSGLFSHRDIAVWNASKLYKKTLSTETSDDSGLHL